MTRNLKLGPTLSTEVSPLLVSRLGFLRMPEPHTHLLQGS